MKKLNTKELVNKIERLTKERMSKEEVISLDDIKRLKHKVSQTTVLVIEDDPAVRGGLKRILEMDGYKVLTAEDGTQLSEVLDDSPIDLILLDVGLPWINGYELAEMMKEHQDLKDIPLVFVSGRSSKEDIQKGFDVGADDYLTKPFDLEKVKKTVRTLIQLNENK